MSETTAMDTREYKIAIPDKNAEEDSRADSPEQSGVCTPKNEHSSGFKRLRSWELSSLEGVERADWQGADDEAHERRQRTAQHVGGAVEGGSVHGIGHPGKGTS